MVRSHGWYVALHAATFVSAFMEESTIGTLTLARTIGGLGLFSDMALQLMRCLGVLALGVAFDRVGPRICFVTTSFSYFIFILVGRSLGIHSVTLQVIRTMVHPSFGFLALGLQDSASGDRAGLIAHLSIAGGLGGIMHGLFSTVLLQYGGTLFHCALPVLLLALSSYLAGPAQEDNSTIPGFMAKLLSFVGLTGNGLQHTMLPVSTARGAFVHESLQVVLLRPEVWTIFLMLHSWFMMLSIKQTALDMAASDEKQVLIDTQTLIRISLLTITLIFVGMSYIPGICVRKFGPNAVMRAMLQAVGLIDLAAALVTLPVPQILTLSRSIVLQVCVVSSGLARGVLYVVFTVYVVGVVGPGERGTLTSLAHFGDSGRTLPILLWLLTVQLYGAGGVSAVVGLSSATCAALLLIFHRSPLVNFRLKET